jgi:hypothetical protein
MQMLIILFIYLDKKFESISSKQECIYTNLICSTGTNEET